MRLCKPGQRAEEEKRAKKTSESRGVMRKRREVMTGDGGGLCGVLKGHVGSACVCGVRLGFPFFLPLW